MAQDTWMFALGTIYLWVQVGKIFVMTAMIKNVHTKPQINFVRNTSMPINILLWTVTYVQYRNCQNFDLVYSKLCSIPVFSKKNPVIHEFLEGSVCCCLFIRFSVCVCRWDEMERGGRTAMEASGDCITRCVCLFIRYSSYVHCNPFWNEVVVCILK